MEGRLELRESDLEKDVILYWTPFFNMHVIKKSFI